MSSVPFKAGGALTDEHATIYIERQTDRDALTHLRAMDYLLVIEPRQQGKTSLINHLMRHPALDDMVFVYLDVTTPDRSTEAAWYQTLCPRILRQLGDFIPRNQWPTIRQNSTGWREFLCDVAVFASDAGKRVVIALDEIGAVMFPGATEFFSVLRDVYNSRQAETELRQLTFLLAGAFHPRDLIKDDRISPFNIAQRVRLEDFTMAQLRELVGKGSWTNEQATLLAERIHYWTDGQPYLTQLLCSYLGSDATSADVDASFDRLRREDENHLPPLLARLDSDDKLRGYIERTLAGERIKFYPREHRRQADLELLGVIKADTNGFCRIRNRIYEESLVTRNALTEVLSIEPETNPPLSERPTIWRRLVITNRTNEPINDCIGQVVGIERLIEVTDSTGAPLSSFEPGWLSWAPGQFQAIRLEPDQSEVLDLVWWPVDSRGKPRPYLQIASSPHLGLSRTADTIVHGKTDYVKIHDSGRYLIRIRIEATEVPPIERRYVLLWGGPESDSLRIEEISPSKRPRRPHLSTTPEKIGHQLHSVYPDLEDSLARRTLALFIGADLPREVTGLPSRADLARDLARRKGLDETLSLAEVAQRVSQAGNRWEFTDFIRNALDTTGKSPQPFHQRLIALVKENQIETIITTAYDNLLELAFQQAGVGLNRVVRGGDVHFINPDRPTLIKLYGDAQQPDTLVVTDRDHLDLLRDRDKEALADEVRRAFRRNTVLFLGYNLTDPDFRLLFDQIAGSRFVRTAYAVWPGLPEADTRMWRDRGIIIMDADLPGVLAQLLGASRPSESYTRTPNDSASVEVGEVVYDFVERFNEANVIAEMADPQVKVQTWDECYCDGESKKAIFAHPHPLHGCKFKYSIRDFPVVVKNVRLDFFIGIPDKSRFPQDDSIGFEVHINGQKRWGKHWNKKQWDPNSITGIEIGPDRSLEVVFVTDDLGRNVYNWAVWGNPVLLVEELQTTTVPKIGKEMHIISGGTPSTTGGSSMDYKRGLAQLKECMEHRAPETLTEFTTLEERFRKNERAERLFGSSENTRNEHSQIIYALNELALEHCGISFNDLCLGRQPPSKKQPVPDDHEIIERLRRIEAKLEHGRAEDRQAATQILDAIAQNRVQQAEAAEVVVELRAWTQSVQQSGLPLNPELREALDTLAEHTGSAYQYLQLALPIIPGILSYNVELGSQHQLDLKAIWERIKTRLGKDAKGDGAVSMPAKPILNTGKAWAVLVGVNHYEDPHIADLKVCVDDVTAIHQALAEGYQVAKLLTDATPDRLPVRASILGELSAVAQSAGEGDLLVFYFSGHGKAERGESYLLSRDTRLSALKHTAVAMRDVRELMDQSPARAKVIVLDACHSGASIGKAEPTMTLEFIQRVFEEAEGIAVLASCKQGQQSWEWPEKKRSVFTYYLLEALGGQADFDKKGFVTVSDANEYVTDGVKTWAAQKGVPQTPTLQYTVAGDIILSRYARSS